MLMVRISPWTVDISPVEGIDCRLIAMPKSAVNKYCDKPFDATSSRI